MEEAFIKKYMEDNPGSTKEEAIAEYKRTNPSASTNSAGVDSEWSKDAEIAKLISEGRSRAEAEEEYARLHSDTVKPVKPRVSLEEWNKQHPGAELSVLNGELFDKNGNRVSNDIKTVIDIGGAGRNNTATAVDQIGNVINVPGDTPEEAKEFLDETEKAGGITGRKDSAYESDYKNVQPWVESLEKVKGDEKKLAEFLKKAEEAGIDVKDLQARIGNDDAGEDPGYTRAIEKKAQQDPKYRKATKSIIEACRDGIFGDPDSEEAKATRNYFMANAIGTFARNLGRDIGNVGAQYTGGTIDSNRDVADWDARKDEILANEITQESEEIVNSPAYRNAVSEAQNLDANELNNRIQAITAQYKEDDVRNYLVQQLQQIGMNDVAQKIANRKLALSDYFATLSADSSGLGSTIYGLLSVMSLPGNFSQALNTGAGIAGKVAGL